MKDEDFEEIILEKSDQELRSEKFEKNPEDASENDILIKKFFALFSILFFPIQIIFNEMIYHIFFHMSWDYTTVWIMFAVCFGLFLSLLLSLFPSVLKKIFGPSLSFFIVIIYTGEYVARVVLQQFYQLFSVAQTAMDNKLVDYTSAIQEGILQNLLPLILLFLPFVILLVLLRSLYQKFPWKKTTKIIIPISLFILLVISGILTKGVLYLPYSGEMTPADLFQSDEYIEDQVEELGLLTMIGLDGIHSLFGVEKDLTMDFVDAKLYEDVILKTEQTARDQGEDSAISGEVHIEETESKEESETQKDGEEQKDLTDEVTYYQQVMDIDFEALKASAENEDQEWLDNYFETRVPTMSNEYTGMFEGYNVIFITAEGFSKYLIDEERTPMLYKMANEGFVFENYYTPLHYTSTSGGEFQNLVGLYPKNGNPISMKETGILGTNLYFTLANRLKSLGYLTLGYHNNQNMYGRDLSHPNLGYTWIQGGSGFEMEKNSQGNTVWPQSDLYLVQQTIDDYIETEPFHVYYLTVSGHMPYNFTGDSMALKNKDIVEDLEYSEETKAYIAANYELEKALEYLVERLEEAGIADHTLIVMTPDHIPYFNVEILEELSGRSFGGENIKTLKESDTDFAVYENSLLIWSESMTEAVQVDKFCGQIDILPTLLNLLGIEYDSRLLAGSDILSDSQGLVIFSSKSWMTDKGLYNRYTGVFTPNEGVEMTEEEIKEYVAIMKKIVNNKLTASVMVIEQDYYDLVFPVSSSSLEEIVNE